MALRRVAVADCGRVSQLRRVSAPTPYAVAVSLMGLDVSIISRHNSSLNSWVKRRRAALMLAVCLSFVS